ncbi:M28 family metallopeptidase [Sphingomonas nostoxanthinifaciens]|uniref:M28 family metallopeptidase n=1 Tax=Sphingomonas nostoxanthinifaciens TaxID=2872652 RepID=UPI001CC209FA|nr:M28 family metallopeptidase [Sphingomonas nostoxanthinifaciens]UAK26475.1 M28 family metallopeptidase [Sphingomonas nostoxanthinifaciens]
MKYPLVALLLIAAAPAPAPNPDPAALRASVTTLVGFGTRHTLSTTTDPKRGIGAARRWVAGRFEEIGAACGHCLAIETVGATMSGPRAPAGVRIEDVVAVQKGTGDPDRVVIVQAHIDSRVNDVMDATTDAPGANDDASGVALVIEAARLLSKEKFPATIVYAALSGEEQGLWGGKLLADTAKARGWKVAAVLNNDIVGNTHGIGGEHVDHVVRVFSEGIEGSADPAGIKQQRAIGGEDDSPSRALAKAIVAVAAEHKAIGLDVIAVRRPDRFQRGGDHIPFLEAGYPAVRFTEATENYDRQHQLVRTDHGRLYGDTVAFVDFPYLAKVTALNVATARRLASAPAAPTGVTINGALADDTRVAWAAVPGASGYRVRWRRADGFAWTEQRDVPASATSLDLVGVNIDDHLFGVAALNGGAESLVTFAGVPPRPAPGAVK